MEFNSIEVARRKIIKLIDLFSGCGGLDLEQSTTWKRATLRVSTLR